MDEFNTYFDMADHELFDEDDISDFSDVHDSYINDVYVTYSYSLCNLDIFPFSILFSLLFPLFLFLILLFLYYILIYFYVLQFSIQSNSLLLLTRSHC